MKQLFYTIIISILGKGSVVFADTTNYTPLAPIPTLAGSSNNNLVGYLQNLFTFGIAFASVLAIFMIVLGGIQYMSTDAISGKRDGKERIKNALFGLLLAILCWLILATVNPKLVGLDALNTTNLGLPTNTDASNTPGQTVGKCTLTVTYYKAFEDSTANLPNPYIKDPSFKKAADCNAKADYWGKQKYTTVGPPPPGRGNGNGCYIYPGTESYPVYCFDLFASGGNTTGGVVYVGTICPSDKGVWGQTSYAKCEEKKPVYSNYTAFYASCDCGTN